MRIEETLRPAGLDWITALRAPAIKALLGEGAPLQPSLFDQCDPAMCSIRCEHPTVDAGSV